MLYYLCIEAFAQNSKATLEDLRNQKQIFNRFIVGQIILTDIGIDTIRKCIRKFYPDLKVTNEDTYNLICNEIFKREVLETEQAVEAKKTVTKQLKKISNTKPKNETA